MDNLTPVALTVAGSDSGGGAGIQADLKTFAACGVFGTSVLTAVTAQNLQAVSAVQAVDPRVVVAQLRAVCDGFPIAAAKTGMLENADSVIVVSEFFKSHRTIPVVVDPVFAATSGARLIRDEAIDGLAGRLFPLAALITPNLPEAEHLLGHPISSLSQLMAAAAELHSRFQVPVLLKGGHLISRADDVLHDGDGSFLLEGEYLDGVNTHGSGCTYAAAIAAGLALGRPLREAVVQAKNFMRLALLNPTCLSGEIRLINHFWVTG